MKIQNPWLKLLLIIIAVPVLAYAFIWYIVLCMSGNPILTGLPMFLVLGFIIYKAIRWKKPKREND